MRLVTAIAVLLILLTIAIAPGARREASDLVIVHQSEVLTLDPQRMTYMPDMRLAHALYECLLRWNTRDYSIAPAAAEAMPEITEDGRVYRLRLRADARWSTGEALRASDFVDSWRRAITPDTAASYASLFFLIDGAKDLFDRRAHALREWSADPDEASPAELGARMRLAAARLSRLLREAPQDVAPPPSDSADIAAEITEMGRAPDDPDQARAIRSQLEAVPRWLRLLDDRASRTAEGAWLWDSFERECDDHLGVRALDDRTLEITLTRPVPYFLDLLCFAPFAPVHRPTIEGWEDLRAKSPPPLSGRRMLRLDVQTGRVTQRHEWARPGVHVGNGPFQLEQWRYKRDLRLVRNPHYHSPARVHSDSILVLAIPDPNTAVLAFESGEIDWLSDVETEYQGDLIAERRRYDSAHAPSPGQTDEDPLARLASLPPPGPGERRNIHTVPCYGIDFFSFNCRPTLSGGRANPFADARVRRAFVLAVDRESIVENVTRIGEPAIRSLVPPGAIPGYPVVAGLGHDVAKARSLLEEAGWSDHDGDGLVEDASGAKFPVIDLLYSTNMPRWKWMSLELKSQWERVLGVQVEPRGNETKFTTRDVRSGNFMIARGRWYGDYGDPSTFLDICRSTDGNNVRGFVSERVDALLDAADAAGDLETRYARLAEAEQMIMEEEVPMLVICQLVQIWMFDPQRVQGVSLHPRLNQYLSDLIPMRRGQG